MAVYICSVCDTEYDEDQKAVRWNDLPSDRVCPVCDSGKPFWRRMNAGPDISVLNQPDNNHPVSFKPRKTEDSHESYLTDIHSMAETGQSIIEPMQTRKPVVSWDDILILARIFHRSVNF